MDATYPAGPLQLLLVEDSEHDQIAFSRVWRNFPVPCRITTCPRAEEALELIETNQKPFDVVITDYLLPGMSGLELFHELRARAIAVPLVLMTGVGTEHLAVEALKAGVDDYLIKDPDATYMERVPQLLVEILRRHAERVARQHAEEQVRQSEQHLRAVLEATTDAIVVVNSTGRITTVNKAAEALFVASRAQLLGRALVDLLPAEADRMRPWLAAALQGDATLQRIEVRRLGKSVGLGFLEAEARPLSEDGAQHGLVCVFRDVTAKKKYERQRTEFLARLTHDLKNPLSVIVGYAALLREQVKEHASGLTENMLDSIEGSALTVQSMVTNYLESVRIEEGRLTLTKGPVAINDLLRQVIEKYEPVVAEKSLQMTLVLQDELPQVDGDAFALNLVITNLLQNAFGFLPEGGQVTVTSAAQAGFVVIAVTDSGPDIAPDRLPFVFDRYQRGKGERERAGTRLGLFMVKTLVEAHGGRVEVTSSPGAGTCFSVFLPATSGGGR